MSTNWSLLLRLLFQRVVVNQAWLEDACIRLLCVLALDRFGDFVTDEVCVYACVCACVFIYAPIKVSTMNKTEIVVPTGLVPYVYFCLCLLYCYMLGSLYTKKE